MPQRTVAVFCSLLCLNLHTRSARKEKSHEEWQLSGVYLKVSEMAASICDIHETSMDFLCWWQNANTESDLGGGCLLS